MVHFYLIRFYSDLQNVPLLLLFFTFSLRFYFKKKGREAGRGGEKH